MTERHREALKNNPFLRNEYQNIRTITRPSTIKQLGRLALDVRPISAVLRGVHNKSHQMRNDEAKHLALKEYLAEEEQLWQEREEQAQRRREEETRRQVEEETRRQVEQEEAERWRLERDLFEAADTLRRRKQRRFESDRSFELGEREFNERLTSLQDIEEAALDENSTEISRREIDYGGKRLTVYDMKGFPFRYLQTAIDYKRPGQYSFEHTFNIGAVTQKLLMDDPSVWTGLGPPKDASETDKSDGKSHNISTSYVDFKTMRTTMPAFNDGSYVVYGFDHIAPGGLLNVRTGDASTSQNFTDRSELSGRNISPNRIEREPANGGYNEVVIRRFDDDGKTVMPSYLIVYNGVISETTKRHAAYFGIPILNVEVKPYRERQIQQAITAISEVNEDSDYAEIHRTDLMYCSQLSHMLGGGKLRSFVGDGRAVIEPSAIERNYIEAPSFGLTKDIVAKDIERFAVLEYEKRLAYIKDTLRQDIMHQKQMNDEGNIEDLTSSTPSLCVSDIGRNRLDVSGSRERARNSITISGGCPYTVFLDDKITNTQGEVLDVVGDGTWGDAYREIKSLVDKLNSERKRADELKIPRAKPQFGKTEI